MPRFTCLADLRAICNDLPAGNPEMAAAALRHDAQLTKPLGSLGRLEDGVAWLAHWQEKWPPALDRVETLIFAGNHGVAAQGVSAYSADVTTQMVANFAAGGAAINQLTQTAGANLRVIPLSLDRPTGDFTRVPAMQEAEFLCAVEAGFDAVKPATDLLCLGEMGIGNTTVAAAVAAGLFGGGGVFWVGRGSGVDDHVMEHKRAVVDAALAQHSGVLGDPLRIGAALGGYELAAILGAVLAARHQKIPVLLDGFVCTAAAAPLRKVRPDALDHCWAGHVSAEMAHRALLSELGLNPLLDLKMRLGEASGATLALLVLRAALACHTGMATFAAAGVARKKR